MNVIRSIKSKNLVFKNDICKSYHCSQIVENIVKFNKTTKKTFGF